MLGWCVYILRCSDGTLYTGCTNDVARRVRQHNGEIRGGAKYTSGRRPCVLVSVLRATSRGDAQSLEASIKSMTRAEKLALVEGRASMGSYGGARRCTANPDTAR